MSRRVLESLVFQYSNPQKTLFFCCNKSMDIPLRHEIQVSRSSDSKRRRICWFSLTLSYMVSIGNIGCNRWIASVICWGVQVQSPTTRLIYFDKLRELSSCGNGVPSRFSPIPSLKLTARSWKWAETQQERIRLHFHPFSAAFAASFRDGKNHLVSGSMAMAQLPWMSWFIHSSVYGANHQTWGWLARHRSFPNGIFSSAWPSWIRRISSGHPPSVVAYVGSRVAPPRATPWQPPGVVQPIDSRWGWQKAFQIHITTYYTW